MAAGSATERYTAKFGVDQTKEYTKEVLVDSLTFRVDRRAIGCYKYVSDLTDYRETLFSEFSLTDKDKESNYCIKIDDNTEDEYIYSLPEDENTDRYYAIELTDNETGEIIDSIVIDTLSTLDALATINDQTIHAFWRNQTTENILDPFELVSAFTGTADSELSYNSGASIA